MEGEDVWRLESGPSDLGIDCDFFSFIFNLFLIWGFVSICYLLILLVIRTLLLFDIELFHSIADLVWKYLPLHRCYIK